MIRRLAAVGLIAMTAGGALVSNLPGRAHASPDICPPACDRIPDAAWIDPTAIPLAATYSWPRLGAVSVTATDPRWKFEDLCSTAPMSSLDPRHQAVAAKALVLNPPGQWQLQVQVVHWRGEVWRGGQYADAAVAAAAAGLRGCQLTAPLVSPSVTTDAPGRLAAVASTAGPSPLVTHQYLVSHPLSATMVELAMWTTTPPLVAWPTLVDDQLLDALIAPLCNAYIGSCG